MVGGNFQGNRKSKESKEGGSDDTHRESSHEG